METLLLLVKQQAQTFITQLVDPPTFIIARSLKGNILLVSWADLPLFKALRPSFPFSTGNYKIVPITDQYNVFSRGWPPFLRSDVRAIILALVGESPDVTVLLSKKSRVPTGAVILKFASIDAKAKLLQIGCRTYFPLFQLLTFLMSIISALAGAIAPSLLLSMKTPGFLRSEPLLQKFWSLINHTFE